jgi:single-strand DNA-binding protein
MLTIGLARIGNEPVVRFTNDNKPILDLSLAYNYGRKGPDGNTPTQWVNAAMFGDRVEKLAPYLHKGSLIMVQLEDLHVETYTKKDGGQGVSLKARIANLQFAGDRKEPEHREPEVQQQPAKTFAEMDDDIPFN